jgi:cytoplasmic iron level regulating protein YaaA (DUF328/UPF0246 family)
MLILLSPSKTMDFTSPFRRMDHTVAEFSDQAAGLVSLIQQMSAGEIRLLMNVSGPLASKTKASFMEWTPQHTGENSKPAIFAFSGDVYDGLNAATLLEDEILFAQNHLRILSGLYGILRPLDLMMPYRLELGIKWATDEFHSLYEYWKTYVNDHMKKALKVSGNNVIINLASAEYSKIIDLKSLNATVVSPAFYELKEGKLKMVSIFAKKARGLMTRFIVRNKIIDYEELVAFSEDGYAFLPDESSENNPVFAR